MKQKYNWDKLKLEYFSSSIMEVKEFFQYQYSTYTGHIKQKTIWWRKEKDDMIKHCSSLAKDEIKTQLVEIYKPQMRELSKMHDASISILRAKAFSLAQNISKDENGNIILPENLKMRELQIIWEMIKIEKWEPIKVKRSSTTDENYISKITFGKGA